MEHKCCAGHPDAYADLQKALATVERAKELIEDTHGLACYCTPTRLDPKCAKVRFLAALDAGKGEK